MVAFCQWLAVWTLVCGVASCDWLHEHPYDVDTDGYEDFNGKASALIEANTLWRDTLRFAAAGDTQGWYDDTRDFVNDVNARGGVDFVVHTGDLSDFGTTLEFQLQRDILQELTVPCVTVIGNHDCLGNGEEAYQHIYGAENYSFIAARIKFVMLNTNALEYDYSVPIPDLDYMETEWTSRGDEFDRTIVVMHAHPYADVFNDNVAKVFGNYLENFPGLMFCLNGHDHHLLQATYYDPGPLFFQTPNIAKRQYYIFTITSEGYTYEVIDF